MIRIFDRLNFDRVRGSVRGFGVARWVWYHVQPTTTHCGGCAFVLSCVGGASLRATISPGAGFRRNSERRGSANFRVGSGWGSGFFRSHLRGIYLHTSRPQVFYRHSPLLCSALTEVRRCGKPVDVCAQLKAPRLATHTLATRPACLRYSLLRPQKTTLGTRPRTLATRPAWLRHSSFMPRSHPSPTLSLIHI